MVHKSVRCQIHTLMDAVAFHRLFKVLNTQKWTHCRTWADESNETGTALVEDTVTAECLAKFVEAFRGTALVDHRLGIVDGLEE